MDLSVLNLLNDAVKSRNLEECKITLSNIAPKGSEIEDLAKSKVELAVRSDAIKIGKEATSAKDVRDLVKFVVALAEAELCGKALTVTVLEDILNVASQEKCEEFFSVVDEMIPTQSNTSNATSYDQESVELEQRKPKEDDVDMELGEIRDQSDLTIDFDLYVKFWKLQSYFVFPTKIYNADNWTSFENGLDEVLYVLSGYKLEKPQTARLDDKINGSQNKLSEEFNSFSAKYLTSQKLFHLQIVDSQFRRYFLVQCIILMNYLSNKENKFRDNSLSLSSTQVRAVEGWLVRCYKLLDETYPNGVVFSESVKRMMENDKLWSDWKNENCKDLISGQTADKLTAFKRKNAPPYNPEVVDLSNPELTRLWNINRDNMAACKGRCFAPKIMRFVDDALDEFDPSQQVEEQYMSVNDEKYQFVCSRFLLHSSEHYLETIVPESAQNNKSVQPTSAVLKAALFNAASHDRELRAKATEIKKGLEEKALKEKEEEKAKKEAEKEAEETREKEAANAKLQEAMNTVKDPIKESPKPKERIEEKRETPKQKEKLQRESSKQRETEKEIPQREAKEPIRTEIEAEKARRTTKETSVDKLRRSRRSLSNDRERPPAKAARIDKSKRMKSEDERKSLNDETGHSVEPKRRKK